MRASHSRVRFRAGHSYPEVLSGLQRYIREICMLAQNRRLWSSTILSVTILATFSFSFGVYWDRCVPTARYLPSSRDKAEGEWKPAFSCIQGLSLNKAFQSFSVQGRAHEKSVGICWRLYFGLITLATSANDNVGSSGSEMGRSRERFARLDPPPLLQLPKKSLERE